MTHPTISPFDMSGDDASSLLSEYWRFFRRIRPRKLHGRFLLVDDVFLGVELCWEDFVELSPVAAVELSGRDFVEGFGDIAVNVDDVMVQTLLLSRLLLPLLVAVAEMFGTVLVRHRFLMLWLCLSVPRGFLRFVVFPLLRRLKLASFFFSQSSICGFFAREDFFVDPTTTRRHELYGLI